jgi:myo-inositol catabolism protein IolC
MDNHLGYTKPLFILAFDHRASLIMKLFGTTEPDQAGRDKYADYKHLIYEGAVKGTELGVPKESAAVLIEEDFGDQALRDAQALGLPIILTTEKSGAGEFEFQYGENFAEHIEKYHPNFTKALVRYNPEGDKELNKRQAEKLKQLSDYSHSHGYKFLIEPIISATPWQLESVGGDKTRYDEELRPKLAVQMIAELQNAGAEPDIWKIEGLTSPARYQEVVAQAKSGGRDNVSAVVLGRGESPEKVEQWLAAGAKTPGVIGFAIGRTIFWDSVTAFHEGKISREEAVKQIGENYLHFYQIYQSNK